MTLGERKRAEKLKKILESSSSFLSDEIERYNSTDYENYAKLSSQYDSSSMDWKYKSSEARSYLDSIKKYVSEDEYKSYLDYLDHFDSSLADLTSGYKTKTSLYSNFSSKEQYDRYQKAATADIGELEKTLSKLKTEAENDPYLPPSMRGDPNLKANKEISDTEALLEQARDIQYGSKYAGMSYDDIQLVLNGVMPPEKTKSNNIVSNRINEKHKKQEAPKAADISEDERQWLLKNADSFRTEAEKAAKYENDRILLQKLSAEGAFANWELRDQLQLDIDRYEVEISQPYLRAFAKDNPFLASAYSVLSSPLNALGAVDAVARKITGRQINPYSAMNSFGRTNSAIRQVVSEDMSDVGSFVYNTAMSIGDSAVAIGLGGLWGGQPLTQAIMSGGAASNTILSAKERGISDGGALLSGIAAGAAEWFFEKYSLESLDALTSNGGEGLKNGIMNFLKQSFTEGSEEFFTEIANAISDSMINGELSELSVQYKNLVKNGYSPEEASSMVASAFGQQILEAFAGGVLSGGAFGTAAAVSNFASNRRTGKSLINAGVWDKALGLAESYKPESETAKRLGEYKKKTASSGKPNASYAGAVYRAMEQDSFSDLDSKGKEEIQKMINEKLSQKGIEATPELTEAISRFVYGKPSKADIKKIGLAGALELSEKMRDSDQKKLAPFSSKAYKEAAEKAKSVEKIGSTAAIGAEVRKTAGLYQIAEDGASVSDLSVGENGEVTVLQDGKNVPASKAKLGEDAALALAFSESAESEMSPSMKKAYFSNYGQFVSSGKMSPDEYHDVFTLAYRSGVLGRNVNEVLKSTPGVSDRVVMDVYGQGLDERKSIYDQGNLDTENLRKRLGVENVTPGTVDDSAIRYRKIRANDRRRGSVLAARVVAELTGRNIVFFDSTSKQRKAGIENGRYDPDTNTIYIDINSNIQSDKVIGAYGDAVLNTLSHELVHQFAAEDQAGYSTLADLVFEGLLESTGKTRAQLVEAEVNRIQKSDKNRFVGKSKEAKNEIAEEEIVARACEDMLSSSRLMKEFVSEMENKDSDLAQKFSNLLTRAIEKIKSLFEKILSSYKSGSDEAIAIGSLAESSVEKLGAIRDQFDSLLERRGGTSDQTKNTSDRGVMAQARNINGEKVVWVNDNILKQNQGQPIHQFVADYIAEHIGEVYTIIESGQSVYIGEDLPKEYTQSKYTKKILKNWQNILKAKNKASPHLGEMIEIATNRKWEKTNHTHNKDAKYGIYKYDTKFGFPILDHSGKEVAANIYDATLVILNSSDGKKYLYDLVEIKKDTASSYWMSEKTSRAADYSAEKKGNVSIGSISKQTESVKREQMEIINETNPAPNSYNTWIRSVDDIRTWEEVLELDDEREGQFVWGDFSRSDAEEALKDGIITVYSSHPIQNGVFVSTSYIKAQEYAGGRNGTVHSKTVPLTDVAWINGDEGQYAKVSSEDNNVMKQDRTPYRSARDVLLSYAEDARKKKVRNEFVEEYVARVDDLDRKILQLEAAESKLALAVDTGNAADEKFFRDRVTNLTRSLNRIQKDLTAMEESKELKGIVRREKAETKKQTKREGVEKLRSYREEQEKKNRIARIQAKTKLLAERILKNNKEYHIPDYLKKPVADFITAIDFSSKRKLKGGEETLVGQRYTDLLTDVKAAIEQNQKDDWMVLDLDDSLVQKIEELAEQLRGFSVEEAKLVLNEMATEQLRDLDLVLTGITRSLNSIDKSFGESGSEKISVLAEDSIEYMQEMEAKKKSESGLITKLVTWKSFTPYTAFQRFGKGGERIYNSLLNGWGKYAKLAKQIIDFSEETWTSKESKNWTTKVVDVELAGQSFKITKSQMMYLYLVNKRDQGIRHLDRQGFQVDAIPKVFGEKESDVAKSKLIKSTKDQRDNFFDRYMPEGTREREVADSIQRYMVENCAAWGNEISMKRWGYRAFTDENYVPLFSEKSQLPSRAPEATNFNLHRILNLGFTKSLNAEAGNALLIYDIFDVFSGHSSDMAKYHSLGLPILDAVRWLNYRTTEYNDFGEPIRGDDTMRSVMQETWGADAYNYVSKFLSDLNGATKNESDFADNAVAKLARNYKIAAVAANLKVALLQPTSYFRASKVISWDSLAKAAALVASEKVSKSKRVEKYSDLAEKYSGMALWKSLGFFDVNISRGLGAKIKHEENVRDKVVDLSMKGAEYGDRWTLALLFKACHLELSKRGELEGLSQKEAWKKTGELLDQVIVQTQVVDSTITRSDLMRASTYTSRALTAFMSEPTVSLNLLMDSVYNVDAERRKGKTLRKALSGKAGKELGRSLTTYAATALAASLIESIMKAWRDDDEDKFIVDFLKEIPSSFYENVSVIQKIPLVKEIVALLENLLKGTNYGSEKMEYEAINSVIDAIQKARRMSEKEDYSKETVYSVVSASIKAASYLTGIAASNLERELVSIWNNTFGEAFDMKISKKKQKK